MIKGKNSNKNFSLSKVLFCKIPSLNLLWNSTYFVNKKKSKFTFLKSYNFQSRLIISKIFYRNFKCWSKFFSHLLFFSAHKIKFYFSLAPINYINKNLLHFHFVHKLNKNYFFCFQSEI